MPSTLGGRYGQREGDHRQPRVDYVRRPSRVSGIFGIQHDTHHDGDEHHWDSKHERYASPSPARGLELLLLQRYHEGPLGGELLQADGHRHGPNTIDTDASSEKPLLGYVDAGGNHVAGNRRDHCVGRVASLDTLHGVGDVVVHNNIARRRSQQAEVVQVTLCRGSNTHAHITSERERGITQSAMGTDQRA